MTAGDIIYAALRISRVLQMPGFGASPEDLTNDGLPTLNDIVDEWSGRRAYAWAETFSAFTLTPGHSPHLIGPGLSSPDFAVSQRPVRLDKNGAALILNDVTPNVDQPITVRDADWWNNQRVKSLTTNVPTDVYYEPDFPNGALYFWPIPDFAYGVRLRLRVTLGQFATTSATLTAPPAYAKALKLTLAEDLCLTYGVPVPPTLPQRAAAARKAITVNGSIQSPRMAIDGAGMSRKRSDFNYYSGQ